MNVPFSYHRDRLRQAVQVSAIVIAGNVAVQRKKDCAFRFAQDANFFYLTGVSEPGWKLIMTQDGDYLVRPVRSASGIIFDGDLSDQEAMRTSGVKAVLTAREGDRLLAERATREDAVGTLSADPNRKYYEFSLNPGPVRLLASLRRRFKTVIDVRQHLAAQRAIKTAEEIEAIRRAIAVTADAFETVQRQVSTLHNECEIEALFTYEFIRNGFQHAYDPIVASAGNACTLHYVKNNDSLPKNGLVLLDIGAEKDGYCADITRTVARGMPSERERAVHAAVRDAQQKIIALLCPGLSFEVYQKKVDTIMSEALASLGLEHGEKGIRKYMPHAISHGLGIDVHDSLGGFSGFKPGMVVTVEPGIYLPEEGIGVRIEDDILITDKGYENLSQALSTGLN